MFVFIKKQYPENFPFLILRIFELLTREVVNFLKSRLIFNILSLNVCKQTFQISQVKRCFNVKSSTYYFHLKTKILADVHICISALLYVEINLRLEISLILKSGTRINLELFHPCIST